MTNETKTQLVIQILAITLMGCIVFATWGLQVQHQQIKELTKRVDMLDGTLPPVDFAAKARWDGMASQ